MRGGTTGLRRKQLDVSVGETQGILGRQLLVQEEAGDCQVRGLWMG